MSSIIDQIKGLLNSQQHDDSSKVVQNLEGQANVDTLDVQKVRNVDAEMPNPKLRAKSQVTPANEQKERDVPETQEITARPRKEEPSSSLFLTRFMRVSLATDPDYRHSKYRPSSRMMFYILHAMNLLAVDNFYLNRALPNFHPLHMRYYFSVLFYIQTLRAMSLTGITYASYQTFLDQFLTQFPPEALAIPGPLLHVFKTICSSQPKLLFLGRVRPHFTATIGLADGISTYLVPNNDQSSVLPNVPAIFAYMRRLFLDPALADSTVIPIDGSTPVAANNAMAICAGSAAYNCSTAADVAAWTQRQAAGLQSPGIEWPVECSHEQNMSARTRFARLGFTLPAANADFRTLQAFLNLGNLEHFAAFVSMASIYSKFFIGSGTLADCSPDGLRSNQILSVLQKPTENPPQPTGMFQVTPRQWFVAIHRTTDHEMDDPTAIMAYASQTNIRMYANPTYPWYDDIGNDAQRTGPFWSVRPVSTETNIDRSYVGIKDIVSQMHIRANVVKT